METNAEALVVCPKCNKEWAVPPEWHVRCAILLRRKKEGKDCRLVCHECREKDKS